MSIEFRSVGKTYPDGTVAVEEFSYTIDAHRIVALVGSSGSGKTTLLRMVNRMIDPSRGAVLIDGDDVADRDPVELRRSIGYVLQAGGLLPHRTVVDNIATVPVLLGTSRREARSAAAAMLERVGLDRAVANRYPGELSGGQQQRVGVARALAADPNILLMDEPFGAVDPIVRRDLQDELLRLQSDLGVTVVLVTHDVDEAFRVGDEVIVLADRGRIAQAGTPAELMANPVDEFVADFIGVDRADRRLTIADAPTGGTGRLVLDADGRVAGVLESGS